MPVSDWSISVQLILKVQKSVTPVQKFVTVENFVTNMFHELTQIPTKI